MTTAQAAVRAWANAQPGLVGAGNPVPGGFYLRQQRSPDSGVYGVLAVVPGGGAVVAEPAPGLAAARIACQFYAAVDELAAEAAAEAYAEAVGGLTGCPQPCGDTGAVVLVHDNLSGPYAVPQPADAGEPYCFAVEADFLLTE